MPFRIPRLFKGLLKRRSKVFSADEELNALYLRHERESIALEKEYLNQIKTSSAEKRQQIEETYHRQKQLMRSRHLKELGLGWT